MTSPSELPFRRTDKSTGYDLSGEMTVEATRRANMRERTPPKPERASLIHDFLRIFRGV